MIIISRKNLGSPLCSSLTSLEENEIGDDGVQWLGQALESNETLCMLK